MSLESFRFINQFIPIAAFGWLMFRTVTSWPAEWAKPDHVWHYRLVLVALAGYVGLSSLGAIVHESRGMDPTFISPLYTLQSTVVLTLCWLWPMGGKRPREEDV